MTSRNLAIVWAPNLLRPNNQDCLRDCGLQALVIEAMIVYFEEIFEAETECVTRRNFTKEVSIDQVWVANCQLYCRSYNYKIGNRWSFEVAEVKIAPMLIKFNRMPNKILGALVDNFYLKFSCYLLHEHFILYEILK